MNPPFFISKTKSPSRTAMKNLIAPPAPWRVALIALVLGAGITLSQTAQAQATAHPPERMTYQGFLVDGNGAVLGSTAPKNYDVIFRIWSSENGSSNPERIWSEQQTVTVDKGYFSVLLGEGTQVGSEARPALSNLFKGTTASDRWVGITVKGIGAGGANVDILPRMRLLSSPYAFLSEQATKLVREDNSADLITSSGNVLAFNGHLDVLGNNSVEFGANVAGKQSDAGRMGYNLYNNAGNLDIVGAGTAADNRKIKLWAEGGLTVAGPVIANSFSGDGSGLTGLAKLSGGNTFSGNQILNNRLGIGESSPGARLHATDTSAVMGILESSSTAGTWLALQNTSVGGRFWQFISTGSGNSEGAGKLLIGTGANAGTTAIRMTVEEDGNVGIGITDPTHKLHVNGSVAIQNGSVLQFGQGYTREVSAGQIGYGVHSGGASGSLDIVGAGTTSGNRKIQMWAEGGAQLNGHLRVTGFTTTVALTEAFLMTGGAGDFPNLMLAFNNGIVADQGVRAALFTVASDKRIKTVVGQSDGSADLATLKKIEITNYKYRDVVNYGRGAHKKVIAQQVEAVYPQAVSASTGVVPDIVKKATSAGGWIQLQADLKVGDRIRVVSAKADLVHSVVAVTNGPAGSHQEPQFQLEPAVAEGDVFIYGREVQDFRSVDYEAIAMLNVSATQELARRLEQREAELADLRAELTKARGEKQSLAENLTAMDARLARLEKVLRTQAALSPESAETALVRVRN